MLTARLILEKFNGDMRLLEKIEKPSRSFVQGFIELLYCAHAQVLAAGPLPMTDIDGVARNVDGQAGGNCEYYKSNLQIGAPAGDGCILGIFGEDHDSPTNYPDNMVEGSKIGIQVGTGAGAVAPGDTALGTRILHGRAAGELEYGGCELLGLTIANPNGEFTIRRYFTNNSGGGITVEETGIHALGTMFTVGFGMTWAFLVARDLTGGVAVANTELLRVTYVVQITV
uniref:Uncharacterized protein n=1 Tax=viral metagenome TaxID=1070528 RepID=A0A6M3LT81_9ZZZZ